MSQDQAKRLWELKSQAFSVKRAALQLKQEFGHDAIGMAKVKHWTAEYNKFISLKSQAVFLEAGAKLAEHFSNTMISSISQSQSLGQKALKNNDDRLFLEYEKNTREWLKLHLSYSQNAPQENKETSNDEELAEKLFNSIKEFKSKEKDIVVIDSTFENTDIIK